ncbi:glycine zipper 2TM domain-containing protein [Xenorhabdus bovienii]|uniref:Glycine zipper 2TM domain-containing protein n=1 Tax=Xenorhabdus bovienii TaxID=40576 RepID=A0AAJ1MXH8_XENBV|nr:glycine zipper 2TM domain-containing protein [Xenorhabdus bovienii]MDE1477294.1 glycine zipper 2TM domain-containing protein [Xenorhabdus bovienii]MDE1489732.1 glycine zipper 2TM domain-containing protein [Xenorhabdus bovienii]MDE9509112.1 glycine zipper 2TM domain-containing protein [Xenorhabdus bovienii]MDE9520681.1 glycine zipper 2TM domain-containing protein [Xenorhabdus bovienii]
MFKRFLVGAVVVTTLSGCADMGALSSDTYSIDQAKQVQNVTYGTILSVRPVYIKGAQAGNPNMLGLIGGAVLGGLLGNTVGDGTGQRLATAAGAIAGGVAGQGIEGAINKTKGVELDIRTDSGRNIVVVQKLDQVVFSKGQHVKIADGGNSTTVSPL